MSRKRKPQRETERLAHAADESRAMPAGRLNIARFLMGVALACSAYLAYLSLTGGRAVGCGPDSDCDRVLASRWAYWFGIPVSILALAVDGAFLASLLRLGKTVTAPRQRRAWAMIIPCALLVAGAAIWFTVLQVAVLKSICPYCMTAHVSGLIASLVALFAAPIRSSPAKPWELERIVFITPASFRRAALAAAVGLAGLAAGQLVHEPKSFVVQQIPGPEAVTNAAPRPASIPTAASTTSSPPASGSGSVSPPATNADHVASTTVPRLFPVYGGRYQLDVNELPTLGAPTNAQVMVALHDYTCHHCRIMHPLLVEAQRTFSDRLVVVSLPMPFDPTCNPLMQQPNPKHSNACEYARLSLAVWRADRTKHHSYEDYLFAGEHAPAVPDARQAASQLVGAAALEKALADPWVDRHVALGIGLYEIAYRAGQGSMPQFIIGSSVAVGTLPMLNLMDLLARNLGLTNGPPAGIKP